MAPIMCNELLMRELACSMVARCCLVSASACSAVQPLRGMLVSQDRRCSSMLCSSVQIDALLGMRSWLLYLLWLLNIARGPPQVLLRPLSLRSQCHCPLWLPCSTV